MPQVCPGSAHDLSATMPRFLVLDQVEVRKLPNTAPIALLSNAGGPWARYPIKATIATSISYPCGRNGHERAREREREKFRRVVTVANNRYFKFANKHRRRRMMAGGEVKSGQQSKHLASTCCEFTWPSRKSPKQKPAERLYHRLGRTRPNYPLFFRYKAVMADPKAPIDI